MPIFEFECESCGYKKEILIIRKADRKESHKLICPKCKGTYEKIMSTPSEPIIHGFSADNGYSNAKKVKKKNDG